MGAEVIGARIPLMRYQFHGRATRGAETNGSRIPLVGYQFEGCAIRGEELGGGRVSPNIFRFYAHGSWGNGPDKWVTK